MNGIIRFINFDKCYGYIKTNEYDSVFFHLSEVHNGVPKIGDNVQIGIMSKNAKGIKAKKITIIETDPAVSTGDTHAGESTEN